MTLPLIYRRLQSEQQPLVTARALHAALEVSEEVCRWTRRRIAEYGFVRGMDYVVFLTQAPPRSASAGIGNTGSRWPRPRRWR